MTGVAWEARLDVRKCLDAEAQPCARKALTVVAACLDRVGHDLIGAGARRSRSCVTKA